MAEDLRTDLSIDITSDLDQPQSIPIVGPVYLCFHDNKNQLVGRLYIPDIKPGEPFLEFMSLLSRGEVTHLSQYDETFSKSQAILIRKIKAALTRLQYPLGLKDDFRKEYIIYLRKHSHLVIPQLIELGDAASLSVLSEAGAIPQDQIDAYLDQSNSQANIEIKALLSEYQNEHRGQAQPFSLEPSHYIERQNEWEYYENIDGTLTITRCNNTGLVVDIPSSIDGKQVRKLEGNLGSLAVSVFFPNLKAVKSVNIGEGIEVIGERAFFDCRNLQSVSIPESVKDVGKEAFKGCLNVELLLPKGVTVIGEDAFDGIKEITIHYPQETYIQSENIGWVPLIILIDEKDQQIARFFTHGSFNKSLIGGYVKHMSEYDDLFVSSNKYDEYDARIALTRLKYPFELLDHHRGSYQSFLVRHNQRIIPLLIREGDLAAIKIMAEIGAVQPECYDKYLELAKSYSESPDDILVDQNFTAWKVREKRFNELFFIQPSEEWKFREKWYDPPLKYLGNRLDVTIPSVIDGKKVTINPWGQKDYELLYTDSFFSDHANRLYSVTIEDGIETIGDRAFLDCYNLRFVQIPASVTQIGKEAFLRCSRLVSVNLPHNLGVIKSGAFAYCRSLSKIEIPVGVEYIGYRTFIGCTNLISVKLPEGLKRIGLNAFGSCPSLSTIYVPSGVSFDVFSCVGLEKETPFSNSPNVVIHAPKGSHAIDFAKEHGIQFVEI